MEVVKARELWLLVSDLDAQRAPADYIVEQVAKFIKDNLFEAEKIKHGHIEFMGSYNAICSVCEENIYKHLGFEELPRCPFCGAFFEKQKEPKELISTKMKNYYIQAIPKHLTRLSEEDK